MPATTNAIVAPMGGAYELAILLIASALGGCVTDQQNETDGAASRREGGHGQPSAAARHLPGLHGAHTRQGFSLASPQHCMISLSWWGCGAV